MKTEYAEQLITSSQKIGQDLNKMFSSLLNGRLTLEGQSVVLPNELELEVKAKYKVTPTDDSFTLEISWEKPGLEPEDD